ncbi:MAG: M48 family metallopeptidase [Spirochaetes bacterium]|nr:M48 family metallopeptidase [Spirochaetota bacterium]
MNRYFIRDIAVLAGITALVAVASFGIYHLATGGKDKNTSSAAVPASLEMKLKELFKKEVSRDSKIIHSTAADKAFAAMVKRFAANETNLNYDIEVMIIDSSVVNAFTFPGGLIVVTTGLIKEADSAEEAAAVIAHEMGHVVHRDSMNALARNVGLAVLFSLGGDSTGAVRDIVRQLISNKFTQTQEKAADDYATALLARSKLNPVHIADFFKKLQNTRTKQAEAILKYVGTHPETAERIRRAEEHAKTFVGPEKKLGIDWRKVKRSLPSMMDAD